MVLVAEDRLSVPVLPMVWEEAEPAVRVTLEEAQIIRLAVEAVVLAQSEVRE